MLVVRLASITESGLINYWSEKEIQKVSGQSATSRVEAGDTGEGTGPGSLTLEHLQVSHSFMLHSDRFLIISVCYTVQSL